MSNNGKFSILQIIIFITFFIPFILLFFLGIDNSAKIILPLFFVSFLPLGIFTFLSYFEKDKFIPKIFLITALFHIIAAIFLQVLKYHILNLPTTEGIAAIGIDNDNMFYHHQALSILNGSAEKCTTFSYLVSLTYILFGQNEVPICLINAVISGFISVVIYKMSYKIYEDKTNARFLAYIVAFSFTVAAYTSVMMRDVYIILLSYLVIYFYSIFYERKNVVFLILSLMSFFVLCFFRAYAAGAVLSACIFSHIINISYIKIKNKKIILSKYMIVTLLLSACILGIALFYQEFLRLDYIISLFDMETILKVSEEGYGGANSSFGIDRVALSKCLPLFLLVGYICMFFAPFPPQWLLSKNVVQAFSATETIILYIFLIPSFFLGVIKGFKHKNFIITASFFYILFIFTFYGMILDNSGAVFRGRAPFIPLIYMISLYNMHGWLAKFRMLVKRGLHI